jgi:protein-tyrosine-phosphatase
MGSARPGPLRAAGALLMVCTGNICRSPTAEACLRAKLPGGGDARARIEVDSAGTHGFHTGDPPTRGRRPHAARGATTCRAALRARWRRRGLRTLRLVLAMDEDASDWLQAPLPARGRHGPDRAADGACLGTRVHPRGAGPLLRGARASSHARPDRGRLRGAGTFPPGRQLSAAGRGPRGSELDKISRINVYLTEFSRDHIGPLPPSAEPAEAERR